MKGPTLKRAAQSEPTPLFAAARHCIKPRRATDANPGADWIPRGETASDKMGTFKVFTLILLLGSISLPASLAQPTPDENDPPGPDPVTPAPDPVSSGPGPSSAPDPSPSSGPGSSTTEGPSSTTSDPTTNGGLTCVTPDFLLGLKLNQDVGLSLRVFGNRVWIEGVDYSSGFPDHSTHSDGTPGSGSGQTPPPPPPPPPQGATPDDRK
ncbi:WAS/WASL-interacting protein family member 2-like [Hippocampus comes]|uniref:WAS/WASL-interacting protein family member 2-like n=1 Tax=Hippocampus comes TaxID=109280 RepID=UPI00094F0081|nr:PREDICTED: WAS/WASL-interacting protein family member 2-like [Hippocampus comes]